MPERKLPDKDSPEGREIIDAILARDFLKILELWKRYGFASKTSFLHSVKDVYDVGLADTTPKIETYTPIEITTPANKHTVFAITNDYQIPYQDKRIVRLMERFLAEVVVPDYLIYTGDIPDFYQISKFDKNPNRLDALQADVSQTKVMLRRHDQLLPNTKKFWLDGNHEYRLQKFLWTSAQALSSLRCLTIPELFGLEEFGIPYVPYEHGLMVNGLFLIVHGDIASIHSGYTAKRMYEKHGGCGICGHCHRMGSFYKRDRFGTWGWWENGCLCDLNPDYIKNPNWVQGFSLIHFFGKRFWVEQIPIIGGAFVYGGKKYE